ncbi:hypothetical protein [Halocola ammonii]
MDYDKHKIAPLIDKFWEGETSLEEEKTLEEYFLYSTNIPKEFADAEQYFLVKKERSQMAELPVDFEEQLFNKIDESDGRSGGRVVNIRFAWRAAAAVLIVALSATLWYWAQEKTPVDQMAGVEATADTYENPREAFEATKEALFMMSSKFNEGSSEIMKIKKLDQAQNKIKPTEK